MVGLVQQVFAKNPNKPLNYRQVSSAVGASTDAERGAVRHILDELLSQDILSSPSTGKYRLNQRNGLVEGTIDRRGVKTYLIPADGGEEVFIPERKTNHAMNGDFVRVYLYARKRHQMLEGEVVEVVTRKKDTFVGVLEVNRTAVFCIVDNKIMTSDIYIPRDKVKDGHNGDKVIVRLLDWKPGMRNPEGEVLEVLGREGDNNAEMHAILAEFGLPYRYPEDIEKEAEKIDAGITNKEVSRRRDMRDVLTFTIDPHDAKDFDDALSFRVQSSESQKTVYEIGVHIADVTHYVQQKTALDKEAYDRGTSVYLVDRTIPMLPEHLSNGICSLRPDEDKLTFSVVFLMDEDANVLHYDICKTVTRSNRRLDYGQAQAFIDAGTTDDEVGQAILKLNELAKMLRQRRFDNGAISFDREEVKFDIDDNGKPVSVFFTYAQESNNLIEEFMLLANRTVAKHIGSAGKRAKTFVYRVHDEPDQEKMANFAKFVRRFGYHLKTTGKDAPKSLNQILTDVKGKSEQSLVETLAVRSMAKAVYSTDNIGHYGLAFQYYTHFTSPIRRYPDMMVHRLLEKYLNVYKDEQHKPVGTVSVDEYEEHCKHCSDREQLAANAERASIKYKQVEFMSEHLGEVYDGTISGVTEWGLYVEIDENHCEGMIPMRELNQGDYFIFDEAEYCLIGYRSKKRYTLGDHIKIRVRNTDLRKKQLDFSLVD